MWIRDVFGIYNFVEKILIDEFSFNITYKELEINENCNRKCSKHNK